MFNGQNAIQMEELASHGYVVFAVSHPSDDFAVIYSDGSVLPYDPERFTMLVEDSSQAIEVAKREVGDTSKPEFQRTLIRNCVANTDNVRAWSGDLRFVADQITKLNDGSIPSILEGRLDTTNMGVFGHSFGGAAAGQASLRDDRFKAFVNLDGTPFGDTVDEAITQPFMVMTGAEDGPSVGDGYAENEDDYTVVSIDGVKHMNFMDFSVILPHVGKAVGLLGPIKAARQTQILNDYVVSFFNKHLKGMEEPLLAGNSPEYPEVSVQVR